MNISVFEASGPVMIGPSSSHTAGAARLARVARLIVGKPFTHVSFGLHGSFAKTCKGHGTDRALVFGALGYYEDDERLADAFSLAQAAGVTFDFYETYLEGMHSNSVKMTFTLEDGTDSEIIGSSIGGASIIITRINGFETEFDAQLPTLVINHLDRPGVVSDVTSVLADHDINIGIMKLSRRFKRGEAFSVIETDGVIPEEAVEKLREIKNILSVQAISIFKAGGDDV